MGVAGGAKSPLSQTPPPQPFRNSFLMGVAGVVVNVVLVGVTLVGVMDVAGLVAMVLMGIAFVGVVVVQLGMVLVRVALVNIVNVAGFVPVMLVGVALVDIVYLHGFTSLSCNFIETVAYHALPKYCGLSRCYTLLLKHCKKANVKSKNLNY